GRDVPARGSAGVDGRSEEARASDHPRVPQRGDPPAVPRTPGLVVAAVGLATQLPDVAGDVVDPESVGPQAADRRVHGGPLVQPGLRRGGARGRPRPARPPSRGSGSCPVSWRTRPGGSRLPRATPSRRRSTTASPFPL